MASNDEIDAMSEPGLKTEPESAGEVEPADDPALIEAANYLKWMALNTNWYTQELTPAQLAERFKLFHR